jgi:hypothetical protein
MTVRAGVLTEIAWESLGMRTKQTTSHNACEIFVRSWALSTRAKFCLPPKHCANFVSQENSLMAGVIVISVIDYAIILALINCASY